MNFGTLVSINKFNNCKNTYIKQKSRSNYKKLKLSYLYVLSDLKGEYKRKTITKDAYNELVTKFKQEFNSL